MVRTHLNRLQPTCDRMRAHCRRVGRTHCGLPAVRTSTEFLRVPAWGGSTYSNVNSPKSGACRGPTAFRPSIEYAASVFIALPRDTALSDRRIGAFRTRVCDTSLLRRIGCCPRQVHPVESWAQ